MKKVIISLATGFGAGFSPVCPGTVGAIVGIPFAVLLTSLHGHTIAQYAIALALVVLAIPICDIAEKHFGEKDDDRIVADEYMLLPICFIAQEPVFDELFGANPNPIRAIIFIGMAFVVSRIFDIIKAYPAYRLQSAPGGFGIVLDDFFANLYAWIAIWLVNQHLLIPHIYPFAASLF